MASAFFAKNTEGIIDPYRKKKTMTDSFKAAALDFVAICNDQTDCLIMLIETSDLPPQDKKLIVDHMKRLQRNLAKATDSELQYIELLQTYQNR